MVLDLLLKQKILIDWKGWNNAKFVKLTSIIFKFEE